MPAYPRTVAEPSREIDVIHETDVLDALGGFARYRREQTVEAGRLGWEFEQRAKEMGAAVPESQSLSYELDSEGFTLVPDRLVEEAGIHAMLHRQFVAPLMDGDTIIGIVTESKAGREAILAHRVIDATGDADVATRAGAPVHQTPVVEMMAASVMFHLAGVDKTTFLQGGAEDPQTYRDWAAGEFAAETDEKDADLYSPYLGKPFEKAIADGVLPVHLNTIGGTWGAMHDTGELTYMNLVHLAGCDGTDPDRFCVPSRSRSWRREVDPHAAGVGVASPIAISVCRWALPVEFVEQLGALPNNADVLLRGALAGSRCERPRVSASINRRTSG